ncbi:Uncharacterized protein C11orf61 like protein, partial [Trachymyrmex cornetzi]
IWSRSTTLLFLDLYQEYEPSLNNGKCNHKSIYEKISERLADKNISFSPKQCMTKLTTMKRMYKKIKDHNSKSGNNRQTWQYYEQMEEIFGKKPWVKPLCTQSSTVQNSKNEIESYEPTPKMTKLSTAVDKNFQKFIEIKEKSREDKNKHHELVMHRLDTLNAILQKFVENESKK